MNKTLKQLEYKAWLSDFEDGLFDRFFGLLFLTGILLSLISNDGSTLLVKFLQNYAQPIPEELS